MTTKICFYLQVRKGQDEGNIRAYFYFENQKIVVSVGHNWPPAKWKDGRPKRNTTNAKGMTARELADVLSEFEERVAKAVEVSRSVEEVKARIKGKRCALSCSLSFVEITRLYIASRAIADSTAMEYYRVAKILDRYLCGDLSDKAFNAYAVEYGRTRAVGSARNHVTILRSITRWAWDNGYLPEEVKIKLPKVKDINNGAIFLTPDEIRRIENLTGLPKCLALERRRFLLQCYTGLRCSDIARISAENVVGGVLRVRMQKTSQLVEIPLNDKARAIISEDMGHFSLWTRNKNVKDLCRLAKIDTPMERSKNIGGKIVTKRGPKWQFVSTHTGRKSFVCNCIAAGVHLNVIMSMTGHKGFDSIKAYINVANDTKAKGIDALTHYLG